MLYEALKDVIEFGRQRWISSPSWHVNDSFEGLVIGGLADGMSCVLPSILSSLDVQSLISCISINIFKLKYTDANFVFGVICVQNTVVIVIIDTFTIAVNCWLGLEFSLQKENLFLSGLG